MAEETQYTANTGMTTISTANTNLDGSGTLSGAIVTAASNGTLIKTVTIKAQANTTQGMVRLFIYDGTNTKLVSEIPVDAVTKSGTDPAFEVSLPVNFALKSGWALKASTEKAESINVLVQSADWAYYASSVRPESTNYTANTGMATITTANTSLTGSGTLNTDIWSVITAASNGTQLSSVKIKAQGNTTAGMVRLFLNGGGSTTLLTEVPVEAVTKSATANSFSAVVDFGGNGYFLKSGFKLYATTQNSETFNIVAEGLDVAYPA